MSNDEFDKLEKMKSDILRASFGKERLWLESHGESTFKLSMNRNIFAVTISQEAPYRSIEIRSKKPTKAKQLWKTLLRITRFCMLFEGEFLKLYSLEFQLENKKTCWSDNLAQEYIKRRMLSCYSSADFTRNSSFMCPLCHLSDALLNKWIDIEDQLSMIHTMALYGMSRLDMPVEFKAAILIEIFEHLCELKQKPIEEKHKSQAKQKCQQGQNTLRTILKSTILEYGRDIFHMEVKKSIHNFAKILADSRHRIFHINRNITSVLNSDESFLYAAKLSMLYRKVLLDFLGVDYTIYSENLKAIVSRWNKWEGIVDSFCKKIELLK